MLKETPGKCKRNVLRGLWSCFNTTPNEQFPLKSDLTPHQQQILTACLLSFFSFFFFSFYLLHNLIKFNRTRNFRTFLKKLSAKVHSSLSLYIFVFSFYLLNNKEKKVKVWVKSRCQRDVVPCPVSNMSSVFNVMAERPKECGKNHLAG